MVRTACMLVVGLAAVVTSALESTYTGPMFNPSEAPYFGYSSIIYPTETQEPLLPPTITDFFSVATTGDLPLATLSRSSAAVNSTSHSVTSSARSTSSARLPSTSASRTSLVTSSSQRSSITSASPTTVESAAAAPRYHGVVGAVVGGLFAGLAVA